MTGWIIIAVILALIVAALIAAVRFLGNPDNYR